MESLNSWAYILYSTCFTREQVDNTFTVAIKFMIYFLTLMWNETLKNACIVNIKTSQASTFLQPDDPHHVKEGIYLFLY